MARITPADYTAPHLGYEAACNHRFMMGRFHDQSWNYHLDTPFAAAVRAWVMYAAAYRRETRQEIGDDYVAGQRWAQWGFALRGLLIVGNLAPLDCGSLDHVIAENLRAQGFNPDVEGESLPPSQAAKR